MPNIRVAKLRNFVATIYLKASKFKTFFFFFFFFFFFSVRSKSITLRLTIEKHCYSVNHGFSPLISSLHVFKICGLNLDAKLCKIVQGSGWWKYEFCHGRKVEQYHEERDGSRTTVLLGYFNLEDHKKWIARVRRDQDFIQRIKGLL